MSEREEKKLEKGELGKLFKSLDGKTIVIKNGDLYGSCFRYEGVDYEKDLYSGRYYILDTSYSLNSKVSKEGGMVRRRISKAVYDAAFKAAQEIISKK